jgi:galactokinase
VMIFSAITSKIFGGAAIALVPSQNADLIVDAVEKEFAKHNFAKPNVFSVTPSRGAGRENY